MKTRPTPTPRHIRLRSFDSAGLRPGVWLACALFTTVSAMAGGDSGTAVSPEPEQVSTTTPRADAAPALAASLDPERLAARADVILARRQQAATATTEGVAEKAVREQLQDALAAATTDAQRDELVAEHIALMEALEAEKSTHMRINLEDKQ